MRKQIRNKPVMTIPLRLPDDMRDKVRALAAKSRLSEADVMRMAIDRGLGAVEKMFEQQSSVAA